MLIKTLSSNEKKVIKRISELMLNSYLQNVKNIDVEPVFEKFIEEFEDELEDANKLGILSYSTDAIIDMEKLKENPAIIASLRNYHLTVMKVLLEELLPETYKPITRKKLVRKINLILQLNTITPNLN